MERIDLLYAAKVRRISCCSTGTVGSVEILVLLCCHNLLVLKGCLLFKIGLLILHLLLLPLLLHQRHVLHLGELLRGRLLWNQILVRHFHLAERGRRCFLRR